MKNCKIKLSMGDCGTSQKCCAADANHSTLLYILFEASRWIRSHWGDHVMHLINKTRSKKFKSELWHAFHVSLQKKPSVSKPPHETSTCVLQHLENIQNKKYIQKKTILNKNHEKSQWLLLESSSKRSLRLLLFSILGSAASSGSGSSASRLWGSRSSTVEVSGREDLGVWPWILGQRLVGYPRGWSHSHPWPACWGLKIAMNIASHSNLRGWLEMFGLTWKDWVSF